ncbi:sulfatase-like hydrolase/transferase [Polaribacter filamentus]|nr:sulfatase-like hydrolase/transferase [Polaribacter filamentus]
MKTFKLKLQIIFWFILVGIITSCTPNESGDNRPNIIYIMVDDMGYADLSIYGRTEYQTPVLDAFINEGMKFTNAYAGAPVCTPTRVALMTGRYPARNEIGLREPLRMNADDINMGLSPSIPTLSSMIKESGYETALFGKWHLGAVPDFFPSKHGFDQFFGISGGAADYIDHKSFNNELILYENDLPIEKEGYLTDLITDYTVDFISKKHDKPFFISLQYTSPHWPWQLPGDDPYPDNVSHLSGGSPEIFAGMVKNLDTNIGRVLKAIEVAGLKKSTLIIFTSDHGGVQYSDMGPFQGQKLTLYEGGLRVPAAVRWPDVITAGSVSSQPVITMDWTVTMLAASKAKIPDNLLFDGINLMSYLEDFKKLTPRKFYWRITNRKRQNAYLDDTLKYLKTAEGEFLFDISNDPGETINLKDINTEKFTQLKSDFQLLDNQMLEPFVLPLEPID